MLRFLNDPATQDTRVMFKQAYTFSARSLISKPNCMWHVSLLNDEIPFNYGHQHPARVISAARLPKERRRAFLDICSEVRMLAKWRRAQRHGPLKLAQPSKSTKFWILSPRSTSVCLFGICFGLL